MYIKNFMAMQDCLESILAFEAAVCHIRWSLTCYNKPLFQSFCLLNYLLLEHMKQEMLGREKLKHYSSDYCQILSAWSFCCGQTKHWNAIVLTNLLLNFTWAFVLPDISYLEIKMSWCCWMFSKWENTVSHIMPFSLAPRKLSEKAAVRSVRHRYHDVIYCKYYYIYLLLNLLATHLTTG